MNEPLNFKLHVADLIKCAVGGVLKGKRCCLGSFNLRGCACCDKSHQQSLSCEAETLFHPKITSYSRSMNPSSSSQEENQQVSCGDTGITDTETAVYLNCQEIEAVN